MKEDYTASRDTIYLCKTVSAEQNTPVFEADKQQPEHSSTPEGKNLSPLVKQLDQAAVLANNGSVKELKHKNFPDIPHNQLEEMRFLGYTTRIGRLKFIFINAKSDVIKETCQREIERITKKRDKKFEESYKRLAEIVPQPEIPKEPPNIPKQAPNKQDQNSSNPFGYL